MKQLVREFVRTCSKMLPIPEPIYEFGSRQVPGQEGFADLRLFFPGKKYVGADIIPGPGVDVVLDLHSLDLAPQSVGTAICVETLEHTEKPWKVFEQLEKVLMPGGTLIISVPFWARIHNYPNDYWRFTPACLENFLEKFPKSFVASAGQETKPHSIVAVAYRADYVLPQRFFDEIKAWQLRWQHTDHTPRPFIQKLKRKLARSMKKRLTILLPFRSCKKY